MKIVNRETFLKMPAGTLFSFFEPCIFSDFLIKEATIESSGDFFYTSINDAVKCDSSDEFADICMNTAIGESIAMDLESTGRDGSFESDQLYAVWEKPEVETLIGKLQALAVMR